jgi:hypothetical protein
LPVARKLALIVGNTEYTDGRLSRLVSPSADMASLADVLRSPDIGQFDEVRTLVNEPEAAARRELWSFFGGERRRDDLLLFYFSGHGVKDDHGALYLAFPDTDTSLLRASALPASEVSEAIDRSRSRRQVVVLDCCHSGAFERGAKAARGESVGTQAIFGDVSGFQGEGQGRVTLTATDATQYAWEGSNLTGEPERSVFTRHLVEGLRTGAADRNGDGWIGVDELYDYVYERVVSETPRQRPGKYGAVHGEFVIARRPPGSEQPVPLPPDIAEALASPQRPLRLDAVEFLAAWLAGGHVGRVLAARAALTRVAGADDSLGVREAATAALRAHPGDVVRPAGEEAVIVIPASAPGRREAPAAEPEPQAKPAGGGRQSWLEWALRETGGDAARAGVMVDAAMAALGRGADAGAAAAAARAAVAPPPTAPVPPVKVPVPTPVRRPGRSPMLVLGAIGAVLSLVLIVAIALAVRGAGGGSGLQSVQAPASGQTVDGLSCTSGEQLTQHVHVHLAVFVNGQEQEVPIGVGIPGGVTQQTASGPFVVSGTCFYPLHTHASDGVVHVEAASQDTLTLGSWFDIWGQPLSSTQVGGATGTTIAYVNGQRFSGDPRTIPMTSHSVIQIDIGGDVAPNPFTFPAGL